MLNAYRSDYRVAGYTGHVPGQRDEGVGKRTAEATHLSITGARTTAHARNPASLSHGAIDLQALLDTAPFYHR